MYLAIINIRNYKGVESLNVTFNPKINIIIGENGCCKTALIDAIRLLYNLGNSQRDIYVRAEDFFVDHSKGIHTSKIEIQYIFKGLTSSEKGALYEYLVVDPEDANNDNAQITLNYELRDKGYPRFTYYTGATEQQKADVSTFDVFQHYYLGALRDSTADLLNIKSNVLGSVIKRLVERTKTEDHFRKIIRTANEELLKRPEVLDTRTSVNAHLDDIFKISKDNQIGLRIEESSKIDSIVNVIKPYLPHDKKILESDGFSLWQNSLGFNNLIYIAVILGDIRERMADDLNQHFALLIEEPEAHLHPQLQLNLYNFLRMASEPANCQLFVTSHSPTLTSKVSLNNIILLQKKAVNVGACFKDREGEDIVEQVIKKSPMTSADFSKRKNQLQRYLDVTKSQLFFARGVLFVEGISEELLLTTFAEYVGLRLEDHRCELVNVDGVSFYPFIHLFNSPDPDKKLRQKAAIITDDDRLAKSKHSFKNLTSKNFNNLDKFHVSLRGAQPGNRVGNLKSTIKSAGSNLQLFVAFKTLKYKISQTNITDSKSTFSENFFVKFIEGNVPYRHGIIKKYVDLLPNEKFSEAEAQKIAILLWKSLPSKAEFAQNFSLDLKNAMCGSGPINFNVPLYIHEAIKHSVSD